MFWHHQRKFNFSIWQRYSQNKLVFHSLKTLLLDLGLRSNYFSLKDRIHTKVPQRLHWNFCLELFGCTKSKHFWRCEKWSRRSWKSFMFKHVWHFLPHVFTHFFHIMDLFWIYVDKFLTALNIFYIWHWKTFLKIFQCSTKFHEK